MNGRTLTGMARPTVYDQAVYDFIRAYRREHGYSPNLREIAEGAGMASASGANKVVARLAAAGKLHVTPGISRGIVLVE